MAGTYKVRGDGLLDVTDESGNTFSAPLDPALLQSRGYTDADAPMDAALPDLDTSLYSEAEAPADVPDERLANLSFGGPQVTDVTSATSPFGSPAATATDAAMVASLPTSAAPPPGAAPAPAPAPSPSAPPMSPAGKRLVGGAQPQGESESGDPEAGQRALRAARARQVQALMRGTPGVSRLVQGGAQTRGWTEREGVLDEAEAEDMAIAAEGRAAERQDAYARASEEQDAASKARLAAYDAQAARYDDERIQREGQAAEVESEVEKRTSDIRQMVESTPKVDQNRWWSDQNMGSKFVMIAGIVANTLDKKADVINMIDRQIQRDIDQQEKAIAGQERGVATRRGLLDDYMRQNGSPEQARAQVRMVGLEQAKSEMARAEAMAQDASRKAALADAMAQIDGELASEKVKLKQLAHTERATTVEVTPDRVVNVGGRRGLSRKSAEETVDLGLEAATGRTADDLLGADSGKGLTKEQRDQRQYLVPLPGGGAIEAATVKEAQEARNMTSAYVLTSRSTQAIKDTVADYKAGKVTKAAARAKLRAHASSLLLGVKNGENLGALDNGSVEFVKKYAGDPEALLNWSSAPGQATGSEADPVKQIEEFATLSAEKFRTNIAAKGFTPGTNKPARMLLDPKKVRAKR